MADSSGVIVRNRNMASAVFFFLVYGLPFAVLGVWDKFEKEKTVPQWLAAKGWPTMTKLALGWLAIALVLSVIFYLVLGVISRRTDPDLGSSFFNLAVDFTLGDGKRNMKAWFWRIINGRAITPLNVALAMRLVNLREVPTTIQAYRVEAKNHKGRWVKLDKINVRDDYIYSTMGRELDSALEMDFRTTCFDHLVSNEIQPRGTIRGWAFFQVPEDVRVGTHDLVRIFVEDVEGVEASKVVRIEEHIEDSIHPSPYFNYNERNRRDLSKLSREFLSDLP